MKRSSPIAGDVRKTSESVLGGPSPLPLYHRLYLLFRERIISGMYAPGHVLPAETELMTTFGVSRITIQRALNILADEGLLTRGRGKGTTVTQEAASLQVGKPIAAGIQELLVNLSHIGHGTTIKLIQFEYQAASPTVAHALNLSPGAIVQNATRVRMLRNKPFSLSVSHVTESVGRAFTQEDLKKYNLIDMLLRSNVEISRVEQSIACCLADDSQAQLLQTHVGAPLLKVSRLFFDENDQPVNFAEIYYHPDRFQFRISWTRDADNKMQVDLGRPIP
ncbi:GntR family transcriptional regulator [Allopusillimonas ginsengisoli]|uniref:GntR family transcriptional regulator n=1 Tax=Allopusillimonas ginsengisoli TaxID=453575 RepID=UPI0010228F03|nr:GntR family transcriptional regulator [Allopusillimonas ginsengisoli]TEA76865.1 GntR family transcriptional regulator [Allopusillimonas ginsengisoli]